MPTIRLKTKGTLRGANRTFRLRDPKLLKSLDSEIGRFRRTVCFRQLDRAFRSLFSHAAADLDSRKPGQVDDPSIGGIMA
jgi:hypothetical protein